MSGLTISEIREALAAQLVANLDRETNVSIRGETKPSPCITIDFAPSDYIVYDRSFGNTSIDVEFELMIDANGSDKQSITLRIDDYLSAGRGNNSSIVDAIDVDNTLGDVVEDCHAVSARVDRETGLAYMRVVVMGHKD